MKVSTKVPYTKKGLIICLITSWWLNHPSEHISQIGSFPQGSVVKKKMKPPPRVDILVHSATSIHIGLHLIFKATTPIASLNTHTQKKKNNSIKVAISHPFSTKFIQNAVIINRVAADKVMTTCTVPCRAVR